MIEYYEVDFIPANWVERAAWWPGLQVHSQLIRVPIGCPKRRKTDLFQSIDLDEMEALLNSLK